MFRLVQATSVMLGVALAVASPARAQFTLGDAAAETADGLGHAVARGDFNGDGYQDLAVGLPREDIGIRDQGHADQ